jgi:hypothetical protein
MRRGAAEFTPERGLGSTPGRQAAAQLGTPSRAARIISGTRGRCSAGYIAGALAVVLVFVFVAPFFYLRSSTHPSEQLPARLKEQLPSVRAQRQARVIEELETKVRCGFKLSTADLVSGCY